MYRIGLGYDVHQLTLGRKLILAGVEVPHELGLEGHSDAYAENHSASVPILLINAHFVSYFPGCFLSSGPMCGELVGKKVCSVERSSTVWKLER